MKLRTWSIMEFCGQKLKRLKTIIPVLVLLISELSISASLKKDQTLAFPIDESKSVTWGDLGELKMMIMGVALMGAGHLLLAVIKYAWGKQEVHAKDIKEIKEMLSAIQAELRHRPTRDEVNEKIREEVEYASRLTKK
jgi:hypothetical protein